MGWEVGVDFKRVGTYVYLWLIDVDIWQKPTEYCKAIILQLKINIYIYFFNGKNHTSVNLRHFFFGSTALLSSALAGRFLITRATWEAHLSVGLG